MGRQIAVEVIWVAVAASQLDSAMIWFENREQWSESQATEAGEEAKTAGVEADIAGVEDRIAGAAMEIVEIGERRAVERIVEAGAGAGAAGFGAVVADGEIGVEERKTGGEEVKMRAERKCKPEAAVKFAEAA